MANYFSVQRHIDRGRGKAAQKLGQPYNVYRISSSSNGDLIDPSNLIGSNIPLLRRRATGGTLQIESDTIPGILWYEMVGDMTNYLVGDVWVQNDPIYGQGASSANFSVNQFNGLALASHLPVKKSVGGRIDRTVQVFRPNMAPVNGMWVATIDQGQPLQMVNGQFLLGAVGDPASNIPAGFQDHARPYGDSFAKPDTKGQVKHTNYFVYMIDLPGFTILENDRIVDSDGVRYTVINPYRQDAGLIGYQMMVEREVTNRG